VKVVAIGELLVEIMAMEKGNGFRQPLKLLGPFPSGAPAIFIDQVAKLGLPCGMVSCVGDDDFGRMCTDRLARDGVDISAIEVRPGDVTGSAFVRYREDGARDFVYNISDSACGHVETTPAAVKLLRACDHLHISGSSLFSSQIVQLTMKAVEGVKGSGGSISFDPNLRKEVMRDLEARTALRAILAQCDTFLPSDVELALFTESGTTEAAIAEILELGVSSIVVKHGAAGATFFDATGSVNVPGYRVEEVDPTGAGDCFDATFIACRLKGRSVRESMTAANASGARAVTVRGPMEGTSKFAELDSLTSGRRAGRARAPRDLTSLGRTRQGERSGITSVCSAHPLVVEAALRQAAVNGAAVLIEATCNQVNHQGGYTGLAPKAFRDQVYRIADEVGLARQYIILGGDHLEPNPWRHLPADAALVESETTVAAYVSAGYEKIHLDTSMGCQGEPDHLPGPLTAQRAARLAVTAEAAAGRNGTHPRYVIGTAVPVPGGAMHEIEHLEATRPEAVLVTIEEHRSAFAAAGAGAAFDAVIALVVQPGVEFDDRTVVVYRHEGVNELTAVLARASGWVFEAHSTDYQPAESLARLVKDGFAILKVGPALTFALREASSVLSSGPQMMVRRSLSPYKVPCLKRHRACGAIHGGYA